MFSLKAKKKDITFSYRTKRNKANIQVRIMAYRIKKIRLMTVFGRNPHEEQITLWKITRSYELSFHNTAEWTLSFTGLLKKTFYIQF